MDSCGRRKYWRLRYWQDGKEKSLSLGVYGSASGVTLKEARSKRDALRKQRDAGLDPSVERKAKARREKLGRANSFEAVALVTQSARWARMP